MAFDQGQWVISVDGVPFRADGDSYGAAQQSVIDMLTAHPELFDSRAKQLGLAQTDLDALKLRADAGSDAPLRGKLLGSQATEASGDPTSRFLIGAGYEIKNHWNGVKQLASQFMGDVDAVKMTAKAAADEEALFKQLDDQGVGAEDLGQLAPDFLALMLPGAAGLKGVQAGLSLAATGAALGAADVQQDPTLASRGIAAGIGAGGAVAGPVVGKAAGLVGSAASAVKGVSTTVANGLARVYLKGLAARPGATQKIVEQAIALTDGTSEGMQTLGRAALDKVSEIVRQLPQGGKLLKDEASMAVVRQSLQAATRESFPGSGVNVFDPAAWEKSMATVAGKVGSMFSKTEHSQMLGAANVLAREMQNLPMNVTAEQAQAAATALLKAPQMAKPIMEALKMAKNPDVRKSLFESLVSRGQQAAVNLGKSAAGAITPTMGETAGAGAEQYVQDQVGQ